MLLPDIEKKRDVGGGGYICVLAGQLEILFTTRTLVMNWYYDVAS